MKRIFLVCVLLFCFFSLTAFSEEESAWAEAPVITNAYEQSPEKLYIEWTGNAPLYQVYVDGKNVNTVIVNNAVIPIKKGTHSINVYPISEGRYSDSKVNVGIDIAGISGSLDFDLASLGLDAKNLVAGQSSDTLNIDYSIDSVFSTTPEKLAFSVDGKDTVSISFADPCVADEYIVTIASGKSSGSVRFNVHSEETQAFIIQDGSYTTLILNPEFLKQQSCIVPELNNKYSFIIQFRKYAHSLITGEETTAVIHESKESKKTSYTPVAAWKEAPIITYASQTADGQITLQWTHENSIPGCEYSIRKIDKALGVSTKDKELTTTTENAVVLNDFMNGSYHIKVVPQYNGEKGTASDEVVVDIKNNWVAAPILTCEQIDLSKVRLSWKASVGVSKYHITVFIGNQSSLLSYVNLDYKKYTETDVLVEKEDMEYIFEYQGDIPDDGLKLKFEMIGIRYTDNGDEQKTAKTIQSISTK